MDVARIKVLLFDMFGTVVDWRKTVVRELATLAAAKGWRLDCERFADRWRREGYLDAMLEVNEGRRPWTNVDGLHRQKLDALLAEHGLALSEAEADHLNRVWHRLEPFPDAVEGLALLRRRRLVATLSNGNVLLLTEMAKNAGLPFDCILSAELFRRYKPDPVTYRGAAELLGAAPEEAMLVASHTSDLEGARAAGLKTAFVGRPGQWGIGGPLEPRPSRPFDVTATDFLQLARKLELLEEPALGG
jgi:2-haloacid dehalogenase